MLTARFLNFLPLSSSGRPPTASWAETPDGIEARFATMILSKFAIMNGLAESGTLKEAAVCIGATGSGRTDFDPKDPGLKGFKQENKYGMLSSAARDGVVLDALCKVSFFFRSTRDQWR